MQASIDSPCPLTEAFTLGDILIVFVNYFKKWSDLSDEEVRP
jgi:hypothetical protein